MLNSDAVVILHDGGRAVELEVEMRTLFATTALSSLARLACAYDPSLCGQFARHRAVKPDW